MMKRYRPIMERYREHDVSKKRRCLLGSCVNLFVANLCLALGIRFDYVEPSSACRRRQRDTSRDARDISRHRDASTAKRL